MLTCWPVNGYLPASEGKQKCSFLVTSAVNDLNEGRFAVKQRQWKPKVWLFLARSVDLKEVAGVEKGERVEKCESSSRA
jgi:hypothetical protein